MKCARCGRAITESPYRKTYIRLGNTTYCMKCFVRCATCKGILIKGKNTIKTYQGRPYCARCYTSIPALTCHGCRVKIETSYSIYLRRTYCPQCANSEKCPSCGRPMGRNIGYINNNVKVCFPCSKPSDINIDKARDHFREVQKDVHELFNLEIPDTPIELVRFAEMQKKTRWITLEAAGLFVPYVERRGCVIIVPYYPEEYFKAVLCHEGIHAWQHRFWKKGHDMDTIEGMSMYVEYYYTKHRKFKDEEEGILLSMEARPASHYTQGLRFFLEMEKDKGRDYVINYFQSL